MSVHQCPRCPLRFSYRTELEFHLREDHDRDLHPVPALATATRSRGSPSPLRPVTVMPRWVVATTIAMVVAVLGLGLVLGS